jgi:flagellar basal body rod protein FlgC
VIVSDLIAPAGKLQEAFFPDGDLIANVTVWLNQAATKLANIDSAFHEAAKADWVYYRAYSHIAERMASEPDTVNVDDISTSMSQKRIQYFQQLADEHLERFEGYVSTPTSGARPQSGYVQTQVVF